MRDFRLIPPDLTPRMAFKPSLFVGHLISVSQAKESLNRPAQQFGRSHSGFFRIGESTRPLGSVLRDSFVGLARGRGVQESPGRPSETEPDRWFSAEGGPPCLDQTFQTTLGSWVRRSPGSSPESPDPNHAVWIYDLGLLEWSNYSMAGSLQRARAFVGLFSLEKETSPSILARSLDL